MKKKFLMLGLGLFSGWAVPTVQSVRATPVTQSQSTPDYIAGLTVGSDDARSAKCSFIGSEAGYNDWYFSWRSTAAYNRDEAGRLGDAGSYEYWSGYYDGLENGYYLHALCGGGGGGGGGPIDEPTWGE